MRLSSRIAWVVSFLALGVGFFFAGSVLPRNWVNAFDRAGILLGYILGCMAGAAGIVTAVRPSVFWSFVRRLMRRRAFEGTGQPFEVPTERVQAVVLPVSPRVQAEQPRYILNHLKPERTALLYTEASRAVADSLVKDRTYRSIRFEPDATGINQGQWMIHDPWRPIDAKTITSHFIEQFINAGLPRENIFVDITAGTVPISVGAFQAAEEKGVSTIYVVGTQKGLIVNPLDSSHGKPVFVSRHTPSP